MSPPGSPPVLPSGTTSSPTESAPAPPRTGPGTRTRSTLLGVMILALAAVALFGGLQLFLRATASRLVSTPPSSPLASSMGRETETSGTGTGDREADVRGDAEIDEVTTMTRGARADEPNSIDLSYEPATESGKTFKALLRRAREIDAEYARAIEAGAIFEVVQAKRLAPSAARVDTRKRLRGFRAATTRYHDDLDRALKAIGDAYPGSSGGPSAGLDANRKELQASEASMMELIAIGEEILDFVDEAKPTLQGEDLVLDTDAQVARFRALRAAFDRQVTKIESDAKDAVRERQRRMDEARKTLGVATD